MLKPARRDAIIKSFNLAERDFTVIFREIRSESRLDLIYSAARQGATGPECLGYIRYRGEQGEGTVEITNRKAHLEPQNLDFGDTTKIGDPTQAGAHGEGLKVGILAMMRAPQNHGIYCQSSGFNWYFNFDSNGRFVVRLDRMPQPLIRREMERAWRDDLLWLPLRAARPKRDVRFVIGEVSKRVHRDQSGNSTASCKVREADFREWVKVTLFLRQLGDDAKISTSEGDLILEPGLRGDLYLKGLKLASSTAEASASITGKPLKFGYNFASGATDRDRKSIASASQESRVIARIWNEAILVKPELAQELGDLLNAGGTDYADVSGAEEHLTQETVQRFRAHLLSRSDTHWYYPAREGSVSTCHLPCFRKFSLGRNSQWIETRFPRIEEGVVGNVVPC